MAKTNMKVAIYCGAFDPIGKHHLNNAINLLDHVDKVWIMPDVRSFHGKNLIDVSHRFAMCQLAVQSLDTKYNDRIYAHDFQIKNPQCNCIYEMMKILGNCAIYYIAIGVDNALTIDQWTQWVDQR